MYSNTNVLFVVNISHDIIVRVAEIAMGRCINGVLNDSNVFSRQRSDKIVVTGVKPLYAFGNFGI
mgnify:CR=1 FL=1